MIWSLVQPGREALLFTAGEDSSVAPQEALRALIRQAPERKYGIPVFSRAEISRFEKMKHISMMNAKEFTEYADKLWQLREKMDSLSEANSDPGGHLLLGYAMIRVFLARQGYNPLVTSEEYNAFLRRFRELPATKEWVDRLLSE
jgi:hypothetical protein